MTYEPDEEAIAIATERAHKQAEWLRAEGYSPRPLRDPVTAARRRRALDPTAILDDEWDEAEDLYRASRPAWPRDRSRLVQRDNLANVARAMDRVAALSVDAKQAAEALRQVSEAIASATSAERLARKLPGVCPRHGPTRDGICIRCVRG